MDTWFRAGKAVNAPTAGISLYLPNPGVPGTFGNPGGDGTLVDTWYDIVYFVEQNALPHPLPFNYPVEFNHPFGFPAFLTPVGITPGQPVFRRNNTSNINFNPVIEFDGSGSGQALYFDSDTTEDVTIFVVFRATGAGNSQETQRLLYGGDVDTHHTSFNPNSIRTNLSLGVSDGNRFSIGRSWDGDGGGYFQSGGIDLLGEPSIGVFTRQRGIDLETLNTYVNGLDDVIAVRNHPLADNQLYWYNSIGKHFNSNDPNRNLTGEVAELLLVDNVLSNNHRQRIESYLALKYGITLSSNMAGQLGSVVGNGSYDYLAADGTVIWQTDPTYKFDIAGIGVDRFRAAGGISLRYNIDQRISKSVNSNSMVTVSTNSDFSTDNLDLTRPPVDGSPFSYDHNYLIWSNDRGNINGTNVELPTSIVSRIEREWKVQTTRSGGVNPISGVSIRVDLSSSDLLNNGNCGIKLLIDTDGDGDFTTGAITQIDATLIDGTDHAFFDGIDFQDGEVFTVGYGDNVDPTGSNPAPIIVCDTVPLPDINVVNDEADNCGVPTVSFISDISNGSTNPETITRTYRIMDAVGNSIDVQQTITLYISPNVNAGSDGEVCEGNDYDLSTSTITPSANDFSSLTWSGGDGSFNDISLLLPTYTPGPNDILTGNVVLTLTAHSYGSCIDFIDSMTLTINNTPIADAPADVESCDSYILPALANGNYFDAPNGGGNAHFANDAITATTTLYVFSPGTGSCPDVENSFTVTINNTPIADAPADVESCDSYILPALANGNYFDAPNGGGNAHFANDAITATTTLYVFSPGTGSCPDVENSFTVTVNKLGISNTIENESCQGAEDGLIRIAISGGEGPYRLSINSMSEMIFTDSSFTIDELAPGDYSITITDQNQCQVNDFVEVFSDGVNLNATIEPIYDCDLGAPANRLNVTLENASISSEVLYALDSTNPNDFTTDSNFTNIAPGNHFLSILHNNGCLETIPFVIEDFAPLTLDLVNTNINEITSSVSGGSPPYTYFFENQTGTSNNVFLIEGTGTYFIKVVDSKGCEIIDSITLNFLDIEIPNFFTPNNDGQNDLWMPKNIEKYSNVTTFIFDRYGRKIKTMGNMDYGWDGYYESNPLPSGDYWYVIKLNDESGREYMGHFTLYR
ncbi:T9SS type B sorting domain-containing protein [Flagellimonas allohymeniacidonis]|uniref:T9SS type B sorting domain-containing protein n=1 Tax=Flagellimonas allohymeniacidonis TaxID=2517819 RepID=UPI0013EE64E3|nr:T9SS type B sorting domain-containing protein [Allomuricauda hymeniacidonis]